MRAVINSEFMYVIKLLLQFFRDETQKIKTIQYRFSHLTNLNLSRNEINKFFLCQQQ